ncbi:MFS transporter [Streptomyces sp. NPDC048604]|uniref:MFS transporter n=1 Tax=Streptomyces sp. NPDC048604 TaxID=3365578 RepID=UPI00371DBD2C
MTAASLIRDPAQSSAAYRRLTLAGSVGGAVIVALDGTLLTVAQPTLQRDLDASFVQVQWTSTGYLIAVASLLVLAGRLGDRYGHRRLFALGTLGFAAASAGIGVAPDIDWVVGLRVAQGVFGALLQPATLGMLRAAYPPDRLGMPLALRTSAIGVAAAAGPLVGGVLVTHLGWRSVFLLTVVPALAIALPVLLVRDTGRHGRPGPGAGAESGAGPEPHRGSEQPPALDLPGAGLLAAALACFVHALVTLPEAGSRADSVLGLLAAAALGAAFVRRERRTPDPLVPPHVLRPVAVRGALGALVAASAALFGTLFVCTYLLQDVRRLDPLATGLTVLPLAVMMVPAAPVAALLARRCGPRPTAVGAALLLTLGILVLSVLGADTGRMAVAGASALVGAGFGALMVTATTVVVRHAPAADAGVAGGLQQTAMNVGPVLGVAVATTLLSRGPFAEATGPALAVLASVAAAGALLATRLPGERADAPRERADVPRE